MKRYIKSAKTPKWYDSMFAKKVCEAYDRNQIDVDEEDIIQYWMQEYGYEPTRSDILDVQNILYYYKKSIKSNQCIESDMFYEQSQDYYDQSEESIYDACFEEATQGVLDFIEAGDAWSYDDVVSETYAQIQEYFESTHTTLTDEVEDQIYEDIMQHLQDLGYIDHTRGILTLSGDEDRS